MVQFAPVRAPWTSSKHCKSLCITIEHREAKSRACGTLILSKYVLCIFEESTEGRLISAIHHHTDETAVSAVGHGQPCIILLARESIGIYRWMEGTITYRCSPSYFYNEVHKVLFIIDHSLAMNVWNQSITSHIKDWICLSTFFQTSFGFLSFMISSKHTIIIIIFTLPCNVSLPSILVGLVASAQQGWSTPFRDASRPLENWTVCNSGLLYCSCSSS